MDAVTIILVLFGVMVIGVMIYSVYVNVTAYIDKINYSYRQVLKADKVGLYVMDTIRMPNVKPPKADNDETGTMTILLKNSNSTIIIKNERETVFNNIKQLIADPMGFEAATGKDFVVRIADILAISFKKNEEVDNPPNGGSSRDRGGNA